MQTSYSTIADIFGLLRRYTVPLFQRPYVWGQVAQWEPLWEDVLFSGWQQTAAGEREVKKALRKSLLKYKLHKDAEIFERAYGLTNPLILM